MKQYIYETFFKVYIFNRNQWACSWVVGMSESIKRRGFLMGFVDNEGKRWITPALPSKLGTFCSAAYHNWTCTVISASSHLNDVNVGPDWQTCVRAAAGWRAKEGKNRVFHHILSPQRWQPLTCGLLWWMLLMAGRQSCTTFRPCKRCFFMEDCFLGDPGCVCRRVTLRGMEHLKKPWSSHYIPLPPALNSLIGCWRLELGFMACPCWLSVQTERVTKSWLRFQHQYCWLEVRDMR